MIIFKDPTFGRIFPDFEQKDVWELIDKLKGIRFNFWDRDEGGCDTDIMCNNFNYTDGGATYSSFDECIEYRNYFNECFETYYNECFEVCVP